MAAPMTISATITEAMTHPVADELLAAEGSERVAAIPRWSVAKQRPVVGAVIPNRVATACVLANCAALLHSQVAMPVGHSRPTSEDDTIETSPRTNT